MRVQLIHKLENAHEDSIWAVAFVPGEGGLLATGSVDESVQLWKEEGAQQEVALGQVHTMAGVSLGAVALAMDSRGEYGAVNSLDSHVSVWSNTDFSIVGEGLKLAPSACWGLAFVPRAAPSDPLLLAMAGGSANVLRIWNVLEGKMEKTFEPPKEEGADKKGRREAFMLSVAVSPDGKYIAGSGMNGTVLVFDIGSGELVSQSKLHSKPVRCVAFTPDSKYVVSGSDDTHIGVVEALTGKTIQVMSGHESWVLSVAVHPSGNVIASGGSDGKVKLFDVETNKCIQTVSEHTDQVWSVSWSEDGKRLASAGDDRTVLLLATM
jgi:WD repeat-containing protein 61